MATCISNNRMVQLLYSNNRVTQNRQEATMKKCISCEEEKPLDQYHNLIRSKDGKDYYCKPCRNTKSILNYMNNINPCTWKECSRPHYAKGLCKIHYTRQNMGYPMDAPKDGEKKYYNIQYNYKLDKEAYLAMAKDGCKICSSKERLTVDHDHSCCPTNVTCGKCVRGIVCQSCNMSLSKLEKGMIHSANSKKIQLLQYLLDYELKKKSLG